MPSFKVTQTYTGEEIFYKSLFSKVVTDDKTKTLNDIISNINASIDNNKSAIDLLKTNVSTNTNNISKHVNNSSNPHSVTKAQVGLGNADNTADSKKNVLTATKLFTARSMRVNLASTATVKFDGSADVNLGVYGALPIANGGTNATTVAAAANNLLAYSLAPDTVIPNNSNLNDYITPGTYKVTDSASSNTILNSPITTAGYMLIVYKTYGNSSTMLYRTQIAMRFDGMTFVRHRDSTGAWSSWAQRKYTDTFVASTTTPKANGTASVGSEAKYARGDHVHPAQTAITGNAGTATKLATPRSINGTNFDGSANITTSKWGTSRNITIGSSTKAVDGSGNVAFSLSDIGAAASSHSHSYLPLAGGTMNATKQILRAGYSTSWVNGRSGALLCQNTYTGYNPILSCKTSDGSWEIGTYTNNKLYLSYITDANFNAGTNAQSASVSFDINGMTVSKVTASGGFVGNASSASKLATPRSITIGNASKNFDGSANISFTLSEIGADEKVKNELKTTTKAYVTGTATGSTNTGTQVFDTGVYLDTVAGRLTVNSLRIGNVVLSYNSSAGGLVATTIDSGGTTAPGTGGGGS